MSLTASYWHSVLGTEALGNHDGSSILFLGLCSIRVGTTESGRDLQFEQQCLVDGLVLRYLRAPTLFLL